MRTMNAESVRTLANEQYAVGTPTRVELLTTGHNDTYVVETAVDRYAFRVYGASKSWIRGDDDLQFELGLLTHLHAHRAAISYPLNTRGGTTLGHVSTSAGERRYALFSWASGQPLDSERWAPEAAHRLGHALATVHVFADRFATTGSRYRVDEQTLLDRSMERMRPRLEQADPAVVAFIEQQVTEIRGLLRSFDPGPHGWGIIHADPQSLNIHVTADTVTLFDFDHCGFGWRAYDIAYALRHTGASGDPEAERRRAALVDGYRSVRPLTASELEMLPTLGRAAWVREGTGAGHGLPPSKLATYLRDPYLPRFTGTEAADTWHPS